MKKEDFLKLGIAEELAVKLEKAFNDSLKEYIPKSQYEEVTKEIEKLKDDVKSRDSQLETLKNSNGDIDALKEEIQKLQKDNAEQDAVHAGEIKKLKIETAITAEIKDSGAKNIKATRALLDLDNAELMEDGTVKGLSDRLNALKTADDSKFLFDSEQQTKIRGAVPGESGNDAIGGKVDFSKMTYEETVEYMENQNLK